MGKITPAILLFIISGLVYIISSLMGYNNIVLISKPIFISSVIFHYWIEAKSRVNIFYLLVLLLYFLSGSLNLFEDKDTLKYVLLLNMSVYSILLALVLKKMIDLKNRKLQKFNIVIIILLALFIVNLGYFSLFFVFTKEFLLFNYLMVYVLLLSGLVVCSTILYLLSRTNSSSYLMLATYCYLICDLFYALHNYSFSLTIFRFLSILGSVMSYYFIINYFLRSTDDKNLLDK